MGKERSAEVFQAGAAVTRAGAGAAPEGPEARLRLRLFGPFEVRRGDALLARPRLRKGQWLLGLLVLRQGSEVDRGWLAGTLWPESSEAQALGSLRRCLTDLRQVLGPEAARLRSPTPRTLALDLAGADTDVVAFDAAIARGDVGSLEQAVALYHGPLLEGCTEEWVPPERQAREDAYLRALETLAAHALAGRDTAAAAEYLHRVVRTDPLRESGQRALMEALAAGGSYAAATQTYRELRLLLHRELNAEPDAATIKLYAQIRAEARRRAAKGTGEGSGVRGQGSVPTDRAARLLTPSPRSPGARPPAAPRHSPASLIGRDRESTHPSPLTPGTVTFLYIEIEGAERPSLPELDRLISRARRGRMRRGGSVVRSRRISRDSRPPGASAARAAAVPETRFLRCPELFPGEAASFGSWPWEGEPEATPMPASLESFLSQVIGTHRGERFTVSGCRCSAAFAAAPDALAAALAIRRRVPNEVGWDGDRGTGGGPRAVAAAPDDWRGLRLRMALDAGLGKGQHDALAEPDACRRDWLLEAGSAGQIVLSQAARDLLRDALPDGISLQGFGEATGSRAAEHLFHLVLNSDAAQPVVVKPCAARRPNLPVQRTSLVGREEAIAAACALLRREEVGLMTMTGPGGAGKTRLGIRVAAELQEEFADGVFFVSLASVTDPEWVVSAMAQTLGVRETAGQPLWESLVDYLFERQLLLLLDNFEQVLSAAPLVAELLAAAPRLKLLVTSRAVLRLREEHEFPVPPLPVPVESGKLRVESPDGSDGPAFLGNSTLNSQPSTLAACPSVQLFVDRVRAVQPGFALTQENAPAVAAICRWLDGLPLAIELAAARIKLLSPQALLSRLLGTPVPGATPPRPGRREGEGAPGASLSPGLQLLTGGSRDLPVRQQSLREAIASSCALLDEGEQAMFRRLSVFAGGCSLDAAEAVCGESEALDGLTALVDNSLLRREEGGDGEPRCAMLETIREYGWECLEASGEAAAIRQRHADYFLAVAERWGGAASDWMEAEYDNLRAALTWYREQGEEERAYQLGAALWWLWYHRGYWTEGRERLTELLAMSGASPLCRAGLLRKVGQLAWVQNDFRAARSLLEQSVALLREGNLVDALPASLNALGLVVRTQGDYAVARSLFEESLALLRAQGDTASIAWALQALGELAHEQGDAAAVALLEESLALFQQGEDEGGIAVVLSDLGEVARAHGDLEAARSLHEQSLMIRRAMEHKQGIARALDYLGAVAADEADGETARARYTECLHLLRELGDRRGMAACLERFAALAAHSGDGELRIENPERAARLFGAAEALRNELGAPLPPAARADHERNMALVRRALGEPAFRAEWSIGRAMSLEQAVGIAREIGG